MELYSLQVFLTVATEKSFSRAAEKLLRTQPAVSLALQRLEQEIGDKLINRSGKELILTDAGRTVLEYARRFQSLQQELDNSLAELRDNSAGRLVIGANESATLYLLKDIQRSGFIRPDDETAGGVVAEFGERVVELLLQALEAARVFQDGAAGVSEDQLLAGAVD